MDYLLPLWGKLVLLSMALGAFTYNRIFSGIDNGCWYAKGQRVPRELEKYMLNWHFIETPYWYSLFGGVFLLLLLVFDGMGVSLPWSGLLGYVLTMCASATANYSYQKYINIGSGLPAIDPNENPKSEFAWGNYSFWWPRFWYGRRRLYLSITAAVLALTILLFLFFFL